MGDSDKSINALIEKKSLDVVLIHEDHNPDYILRKITSVRISNKCNHPIIIYSDCDDPEDVIRIMRSGVDNYLLKKKSFEVLRANLISCFHRSARHYLLQQANQDGSNEEELLQGVSDEIKKLRYFVKKVASADIPVMLLGESGTGKNLVAQSIHAQSQRRDKNFLVVNCGAIPDTLVESELFGSEVGAFTGAIHRKGMLARAHKGTLFLDELGDLVPLSQAKFLRVIEEKKYVSLGGEHEHVVDVRFITATNKDISKMIAQNTFRNDLYYRCAILHYTIAPLRERKEDIVPLVQHFLRKDNVQKRFTSSAIDRLMAHSWPGNIRELKSCIIRTLVLSEGDNITEKCICF